MLRTNSPQWTGPIGRRSQGEGLFSVASMEKKDPGLDVTDDDRQAKAKRLFIPQPRRVTSPELIFRGSSLDRCEKEELCSVHEDVLMEGLDMNDEGDKWHFRSIQRPDLNLQSPPRRTENPLIMDERFHDYAMSAPVAMSFQPPPVVHRPVVRPKAEYPSTGKNFKW
ncbi:unnamed protein product [Aphanomyces euteiches]|uniref:Uncharacterized protein n=1 Tax=Aphanomyces euteiches TaxID=100861 RepID=A0A6G0XF50_9STRA|nr:hypothetical protein Ae201684_005387 [Aphanomyces euteiches]KAH9106971.1 hypothetical protein AeMF1_017540 [Aphanomyces euteiches]KAH9130681.1 hypothetical protein LEN26_008298 [Aphanomyces euteiches]KAH9157604.1 hypothetical protein AeRB84_000540 [Aphanomyces euteiches]KAH9191576.1 hypothetical protein AeNC1_006451 [Aphanomyces euteiches]